MVMLNNPLGSDWGSASTQNTRRIRFDTVTTVLLDEKRKNYEI